MKKFKIKYLDSSLMEKEKIINASCEETAELIFSNNYSYSKIISVEEE